MNQPRTQASIYAPGALLLRKNPTELYNYWRSGSPRKSEAENMADFGLC